MENKKRLKPPTSNQPPHKYNSKNSKKVKSQPDSPNLITVLSFLGGKKCGKPCCNQQ
jgi:hypothetical protein